MSATRFGGKRTFCSARVAASASTGMKHKLTGLSRSLTRARRRALRCQLLSTTLQQQQKQQPQRRRRQPPQQPGSPKLPALTFLCSFLRRPVTFFLPPSCGKPGKQSSAALCHLPSRHTAQRDPATRAAGVAAAAAAAATTQSSGSLREVQATAHQPASATHILPAKVHKFGGRCGGEGAAPGRRKQPLIVRHGCCRWLSLVGAAARLPPERCCWVLLCYCALFYGASAVLARSTAPRWRAPLLSVALPSCAAARCCPYCRGSEQTRYFRSTCGTEARLVALVSRRQRQRRRQRQWDRAGKMTARHTFRRIVLGVPCTTGLAAARKAPSRRHEQCAAAPLTSLGPGARCSLLCTLLRYACIAGMRRPACLGAHAGCCAGGPKTVRIVRIGGLQLVFNASGNFTSAAPGRQRLSIALPLLARSPKTLSAPSIAPHQRRVPRRMTRAAIEALTAPLPLTAARLAPRLLRRPPHMQLSVTKGEHAGQGKKQPKRKRGRRLQPSAQRRKDEARVSLGLVSSRSGVQG